MPAKSSSPEAAQKRVWKAELRTHQKNRQSMLRDFKKAHRLSEKECAQAIRSAQIAKAKHRKDLIRLGKSEARETAAIDKRIAILKGRIGI